MMRFDNRLIRLIKLFKGQIEYEVREILILISDKSILRDIRNSPSAIFVSKKILPRLGDNVPEKLASLFYCVESEFINNSFDGILRKASELKFYIEPSFEFKGKFFVYWKESGLVIFKGNDGNLVIVNIYDMNK